jgi:hypothetical protein
MPLRTDVSNIDLSLKQDSVTSSTVLTTALMAKDCEVAIPNSAVAGYYKSTTFNLDEDNGDTRVPSLLRMPREVRVEV